MSVLINRLFNNYDIFFENKFNKLTPTHAETMALINESKENSLFEVSLIGKSVEERDIYLIKAGKGPINVMLWSQMHGNEPTATKALFDIFRLLSIRKGFENEIDVILNACTLYFVPMVNPDGAERFTRVNAMGIDLNRDARDLQAPESKLLKKLRDKINAEFGFNLHDQRREFGAYGTGKPATISFLAPAFNQEKEIDSLREKSMKLIALMNDGLQKLVPGHIGKYSDAFEPRAFGDNVQKWGTSTILIESGGYYNDYKRQFVRKLNFCTIVDALYAISTSSYQEFQINDYLAIPDNKLNCFDLIIRNATILRGKTKVKADIGIFYSATAMEDEKHKVRKSRIVNIGDLKGFCGYEELDVSGMIVESGKISEEIYENIEDISQNKAIDLLKTGIVSIKTRNFADKNDIDKTFIDFITIDSEQQNEIFPEKKANFVIRREDEVVAAVVNGRLIKLQN